MMDFKTARIKLARDLQTVWINKWLAHTRLSFDVARCKALKDHKRPESRTYALKTN